MGEGKFSNRQVVKLLRSVAAALTLKKTNPFQIRAYENAADSIEHLDSEIKDVWEEGKIDGVPGIGKNLQEHLSELFKTGVVKHFESLMRGVNPVIFDLLDIPGIGPKTAQELAELGIKDLNHLKSEIKSGEIIKKGFSGKIAEKIMSGLEELSGRGGRMLLPYASAQAQRILAYLQKSPLVLKADPLGSLRRQVATIGDLDFSVSAKSSKEVVDYFIKMPGVSRIIDHGTNKASVVLNSGLQADLLVGEPGSYGALLQHFTGSKNHNIHLRSIANTKGYSLSEYGLKKVKSQKSKVKNGEVLPCKTEDDLYGILGMEVPPPEIREDTGEIEAAIAQKLPKLVGFKDIKGDLHTHSNFPMVSPSHGPGANSIDEIITKARALGYGYIGISDHPPGFRTTTKDQIVKILEKRTKVIQNLKKSLPADLPDGSQGRQGTKSIRVLNGLEVDILGDGSLSVPDEILKTLDYCIAGIHSGHRGTKEQITKRLVKALGNPYVDIISHPTNRLLNERESSEADWEEIFKLCAKNQKILEVNAYPNRLDLRDDLVRQALSFGCKFIIDTDAHEVAQMENMKFGVSVARRGWAEGKDIINSWDWTKFAKWFKIN
ncbi:DNA polymerase III [Candidatus Daviesbacteria bacterium]|nr:DNA polymerase III [Candidatus Daviesbacteria bacterium]